MEDYQIIKEKKAVDEMGVDEMGVGKTGVDETEVDKMGRHQLNACFTEMLFKVTSCHDTRFGKCLIWNRSNTYIHLITLHQMVDCMVLW